MTKAYYDYIKENATDYLYIFDITRGRGRCIFFCKYIKFRTDIDNEKVNKQVNELIGYIDKRKKSNDKQEDTSSH